MQVPYDKITRRNELLIIPYLHGMSFHLDKSGEGFIKFRLSSLVDINDFIKDKVTEARVSSSIHLEIQRTEYYMGSVNGVIPVASEDIGSRAIQYGCGNLWAKIFVILMEVNSDA